MATLEAAPPPSTSRPFPQVRPPCPTKAPCPRFDVRADFCALRFVEESSEILTVRQDVPEPPQLSMDRGAMVTVIHQGGLGYAATSDLTPAGLREAAERARRLAQLTAGRSGSWITAG